MLTDLQRATEVEWDGEMIALEDEDLWSGWDEMIDWCAGWESLPEYVFATKPIITPKLYASDLVYQLIEEMGIEKDDEVKFGGVEELQQALDKFWEQNKDLGWRTIDYSRKIRVPGDILAEWANR